MIYFFMHLYFSGTPTGRRVVFAGRIAGEALARKVHIARRGQTVAPFRRLRVAVLLLTGHRRCGSGTFIVQWHCAAKYKVITYIMHWVLWLMKGVFGTSLKLMGRLELAHFLCWKIPQGKLRWHNKEKWIAKARENKWATKGLSDIHVAVHPQRDIVF